MTVWLVAQYLYAAVAWFTAGRVVIRAYTFGGALGRDLSATVRELRQAGRGAEVATLGIALEPSPVAEVLALDADDASPIELVSVAEQASRDLAPPTRLLRSLATAGTMLGMLSAVATLHVGLGAHAPGAMEQAASHALDSAVVGFVTALPCWTAVALARRRARETYSDLERLLLAMRSESKVGSDPAVSSNRPMDDDPDAR